MSDAPYCSEAGRILYITGTHGNTAGVSGLTYPEMLDHSLYLEDCRKVGVLPGPGPEDLQEEQKNTILFAFIIYIVAIFMPFNIYQTLWIDISLLAFIRLQLGIARR